MAVGTPVGPTIPSGAENGRFEAALALLSKRYIVHQNVRAIGRRGLETGRPMLEISVSQPFAPAEAPPDEVYGFHVHVVVDGNITKQSAFFPRPSAISLRGHHDKLFPGLSVGPVDESIAGTIGAFVTDGAATYLLGSSFALSNANRVKLGTPIISPSSIDGGTLNDKIGTLVRVSELQRSGLNVADFAIASIHEPHRAINDIPGIGPIGSPQPPLLGMRVEKLGRTTGHTFGTVRTTNATVKVEVGADAVVFEDQFMIDGDGGVFSAAGDSGALIVESGTGRAVGLIVGGSPQITIASSIITVLDVLGGFGLVSVPPQ